MPDQFATPNLWSLSGNGIFVRYSTNPLIFGGVHLDYQDNQRSLSFSGDQIRAVEVPDLGSTVSVTIAPTVDAGSTTFTLLLPRVNILVASPISSTPVSAIGITMAHAGVLSPPFGHGQQDFYSVVPFTGTASHIAEL